MRIRLSLVLGFIGAAIALTIAFWLARIFLAPAVFFALWSGGGGTPAVLALVAIAPILVAIPFGVAFGLAPLRRPLSFSFAVVAVAALLVIAHAGWAGTLTGTRWWATPVEVLMFAGMLVAVVYATSRLTRRSTRTRLRRAG
jgi:hypothetical protein